MSTNASSNSHKMATKVTQEKMAVASGIQNKVAAGDMSLNHNKNASKMALGLSHSKIAATGTSSSVSSIMLMQQIQTLSDLQNSSTLHHADPIAQVSNCAFWSVIHFPLSLMLKIISALSRKATLLLVC
jgi:hypothetical protein